MYTLLSVVQNTINPSAGSAICETCVCVRRGSKTPFSYDFTSSMAERSGALLSLLMPTWANDVTAVKEMAITKTQYFFMGIRFIRPKITEINEKEFIYGKVNEITNGIITFKAPE